MRLRGKFDRLTLSSEKHCAKYEAIVESKAERASRLRAYVAARLALLEPFPVVRVFLPLLVLLLFCSAAFGFDLAFEPARTTSRPTDLWRFLPLGYLFTVMVEAPVLVLGLSKKFSFRERLFAGLWLTACTYPVVVLVLPTLFATSSRTLYLLVAETFAPAAECALFWFVFKDRLRSVKSQLPRSFAVIILANLLSFALGELLNSVRWFGLF